MNNENYVLVNGRKIRIRPSETNEIDQNGYFRRQKPVFTEIPGSNLHPIEKNRYIYLWSRGCSWSNRIKIIIDLLGLQDIIKTEEVDWTDREENLGWEFVNSPNHINPETGAQFISELYYNTDPDYALRTTIPVLIDYQTGTVVNNDHQLLSNHLETVFSAFHKEGAPNLYPLELRNEIDEMNRWLYVNVNDGIYRAVFAKSPEAYSEGFYAFYDALEKLEQRLESKRFLFGRTITDSDVRLYSTLVRLDLNYCRHIGPTPGRLVDYKNLWGYCRDLYQIPEFRKNTWFKELSTMNDSRFRKNPYYDIYLPSLDLDAIWIEPTGRDKFV